MIIKKEKTNTHSTPEESFDIKKDLKFFKLLADLITLHPSSTKYLVEMSGISSADIILKILKGKGKEVCDLDLNKISNFMGLDGDAFKAGHTFYLYDGRHRNKIKEIIPRIFRSGAYYLQSKDFVYINNNRSFIIVNAMGDFIDDVLKPISNIHPGKINPHFASVERFNPAELSNYFIGNNFDLFVTWSDIEDLAKKSRVELQEVLCFIRRSNALAENSDWKKSQLAALAIQDMTRTAGTLRP